jgi:hypothetical protein
VIILQYHFVQMIFTGFLAKTPLHFSSPSYVQHALPFHAPWFYQNVSQGVKS